MTTENKEPLAVIETLVKALEKTTEHISQMGDHTPDSFNSGLIRCANNCHQALTEARAFVHGRGEVERIAVVFNRYETKLPDPKHYDSSYGGQWSSDWCLCLTADGGARVEKFTVGRSEKEALVSGRRSYSNWHKPGWNSQYVAWAYVNDVTASFSSHPQATQPAPSTAGEMQDEPDNWSFWDDVGLHCVGYSSEIDHALISVFMASNETTTLWYKDTAKALGLDELLVVFLKEILCGARFCDYGTSPRGAWADSETYDDNLARLKKWFERKWGGPFEPTQPVVEAQVEPFVNKFSPHAAYRAFELSGGKWRPVNLVPLDQSDDQETQPAQGERDDIPRDSITGQPTIAALLSAQALPVGELTDNLKRFERAVGRKDVLHHIYSGKAMPDDMYQTFATLRDDTIPALRAAILAAARTQPELVPMTDERKEAMAIYTPPFKYKHGYIFDSHHKMVADDDKVDEAVAARIRGWGKLSYLSNGAAIQDELGQMLADALTAYYFAHGITKKGEPHPIVKMWEAEAEAIKSAGWVERTKKGEQ